jgi:hypothetical protein
MCNARRWLLAPVVASTLGGVLAFVNGDRAAFAADSPSKVPANTSAPTGDGSDMQAQIDALQAKVAALQARQAALQSASQQKTIDAVQSDAAEHSKMFDSDMGVTAGHANGRFFIQSDDGNFVLRPWIHLQVRDTTNNRDHELAHNGDDTENGIEIRRARLGFDGNLFTPDLTYFINWATFRGNGSLTVKNSSGSTVGTTSSPVGGLPVLEEAWILYHFHNTPWSIHVGQMHDPLDHENIVGSKYRQPEASLQGDIFGNTDTFTQAITGVYGTKDMPLHIEGGITDGIRAANTNFQDAPNNGIGYDGGVAGRLEYKFMGDWHDYSQLTAYGNHADLLVAGAGVDYSWGQSRFTSLSHTLDVQYGGLNGWFLYACYFGRYTTDNPGIPNGAPVSTSFGGSGPDLGKDTYEPSIDVLVAYNIPTTKFEPFGRFEFLDLKGTPTGSKNDVTDLSVGLNYYMYGHNLKLTGMLTYLPNGIPISDDSADVEVSNGHQEIIFLTQAQLLL